MSVHSVSRLVCFVGELKPFCANDLLPRKLHACQGGRLFLYRHDSDTHDEQTPLTQSEVCLGQGLLARGRSRGPSSRLCPVTSREFPCALASDPICRGVCVRAREMAPRGSKNDRKTGGGGQESQSNEGHTRDGRGMENGQVCVPFLAAAHAVQRAEKESLHAYKTGVYIHSQAFNLL